MDIIHGTSAFCGIQKRGYPRDYKMRKREVSPRVKMKILSYPEDYPLEDRFANGAVFFKIEAEFMAEDHILPLGAVLQDGCGYQYQVKYIQMYQEKPVWKLVKL